MAMVSRVGIRCRRQLDDASAAARVGLFGPYVIRASAADTTPPTLSSPSANATGQTTANASVSTDEGNGTLYVLISTASSASAGTIRSTGQSSTVTATGTQAASFSGLTAATTYYVHWVHDDAAGNASSVASSASITTDSPPATGTLPAHATSRSGIYGRRQASAALQALGGIYGPWQVGATISGTPDTEAPSLSGSITVGTVTTTSIAITWPDATDNVGVDSYDVSGDGGSSWTNTGGTATNHTFSGLSPATGYALRVRARDAADNVSAALSASVTTASPSTATITSSPLKENTGDLHLSAPFEATAWNAATGDKLLAKTGLTSHASTGVVTFSDAALVAGTPVLVRWRRTDTGATGFEVLTPA